jgi:hypothetical protein
MHYGHDDRTVRSDSLKAVPTFFRSSRGNEALIELRVPKSQSLLTSLRTQCYDPAGIGYYYGSSN